MDYKNKPKGYYNNVRTEMLNYLPNGIKKVLDVGCGNGAFAEIIKSQNEIEVWGIEYMEDQARDAKTKLDKVFIGKCEAYLNDLPENYFDVIYFNDVLEHLEYPDKVLEAIKYKLSKNGIVISSIPNMRFFKTFMKLFLRKDWKYEDYGIMDKTHLRWFTKKSIKRMYTDLGFKVLTHEGINKSKSLKPYLFHLLTLFTHYDMQYLQFATVAQYSK